MTHDRDDANASPNGQLQTTRLPLPTMNCPWNARRTADYLQRVEGVIETTVEPRSGTVVVRYDPNRTSEAALTTAAENPEASRSRHPTPARSGHRSDGCRCRGRGRSRCVR